jgi:hypothetical protein
MYIADLISTCLEFLGELVNEAVVIKIHNNKDVCVGGIPNDKDFDSFLRIVREAGRKEVKR